MHPELTCTPARPPPPVRKTSCLTGPRRRLATGGTEGGASSCARTPGCTSSPGQPSPHPEPRPGSASTRTGERPGPTLGQMEGGKSKTYHGQSYVHKAFTTCEILKQSCFVEGAM